MYVYGYEILCCPPETITTLLMAILQNKIKSFLSKKKKQRLRDAALFGKTPPSWPNHLPKAPAPDTIILDLGI